MTIVFDAPKQAGLILADVTPLVIDILKKSGALATVGENNVFPVTPRILAAEQSAWDVAQAWLAQTGKAVVEVDSASSRPMGSGQERPNS